MTIELTQEQQKFIAKEIAAGKYADESALLKEAVDLLRQRETYIAKVQAGVQRGLDDLKAGRYREIHNSQDAEALKQDILQRGQQLRAQREQTTH